MREAVIAGLGLIGGSIGKALRKRGWRVRFLDPAVTLDDARDAGAADEKVESFEFAELVVLATPVDVALRQLHELQASRALVTTTCSVMHPFREHAGHLRLVAGHPFAGSERSGLASAEETLFAGKPWFLDRPDADVVQLVRDCGAEPVTIDPFQHDESLALTSHLPQIMATALASLLAGVDPVFIGSGARSILRLAGSSHAVWGPTLEQNAANVHRAANDLASRMLSLSARDFERAQRLYRTIQESGAQRER